jgi:hypothetical protein
MAVLFSLSSSPLPICGEAAPRFIVWPFLFDFYFFLDMCNRIYKIHDSVFMFLIFLLVAQSKRQ